VASGISSGGSSSGEVLSGVLRDASLASLLPSQYCGLSGLRGESESESAPHPRTRASGLEGPSWGPRGGRGWGVAVSCWCWWLVAGGRWPVVASSGQ
jgi:hypothetical protein